MLEEEQEDQSSYPHTPMKLTRWCWASSFLSAQISSEGCCEEAMRREAMCVTLGSLGDWNEWKWFRLSHYMLQPTHEPPHIMFSLFFCRCNVFSLWLEIVIDCVQFLVPAPPHHWIVQVVKKQWEDVIILRWGVEEYNQIHTHNLGCFRTSGSFLICTCENECCCCFNSNDGCGGKKLLILF